MVLEMEQAILGFSIPEAAGVVGKGLNSEAGDPL